MSDTYDDPNTQEELPPPVETLPPSSPASGDKAWQNYVIPAINRTYPHLRNGTDYAWSRKDGQSDGEFTYWDEEKLQPADIEKIEATAKQMAKDDPRSGYVDPDEPEVNP